MFEDERVLCAFDTLVISRVYFYCKSVPSATVHDLGVESQCLTGMSLELWSQLNSFLFPFTTGHS